MAVLDIIMRMRQEMEEELVSNILPFWINRMTDEVNGGFYGRITGREEVKPEAEKGAILNARILWTFSAAYRLLFAGNLTKHPCFDQMRASGKGYRIAGSLENTDRIMKDTFWIGVYPGMTDEMLQAMADAIKDALN